MATPVSPSSIPSSGKRFDFSRNSVWARGVDFGEPSRWRWVSSLGEGESEQLRHLRHERWTRVKGNTHAPAHREILLTLQGRAVYSYRGQIYQRQPGTVILLDAHERRDWQGAPWKRNFSCLWLEMHGRGRLSHYINHCDADGRHRRVAPFGMVAGQTVELVNDAWDHCLRDPHEPAARGLLKSGVAALLLAVLGSPAPVSANALQREIILSIVDYIEVHLGEKLSLSGLARLAGYSPHHFHRLFVACTGQTPVSFVNTARLRAAQKLLRQGITVDAVAEAVGFSSVSYFSEFFKRQTGQSPGAWRSDRSVERE